MSRPKLVTKESINAAITKIKRRKEIRSDSDIYITLIASVLGCSRQALYDKEFDDILFRYKKLTQNKGVVTESRGTIKYYKEVVTRRDKKIEELEKKLRLAQDNLIDQEVLIGNIQALEQEKERFLEDRGNSKKKIKILTQEGERLRRALLKRT